MRASICAKARVEHSVAHTPSAATRMDLEIFMQLLQGMTEPSFYQLAARARRLGGNPDLKQFTDSSTYKLL
jgi:hypothetical protein